MVGALVLLHMVNGQGNSALGLKKQGAAGVAACDVPARMGTSIISHLFDAVEPGPRVVTLAATQ